jgi:hypothetical protein
MSNAFNLRQAKKRIKERERQLQRAIDILEDADDELEWRIAMVDEMERVSVYDA